MHPIPERLARQANGFAGPCRCIASFLWTGNARQHDGCCFVRSLRFWSVVVLLACLPSWEGQTDTWIGRRGGGERMCPRVGILLRLAAEWLAVRNAGRNKRVDADKRAACCFRALLLFATLSHLHHFVGKKFPVQPPPPQHTHRGACANPPKLLVLRWPSRWIFSRLAFPACLPHRPSTDTCPSTDA
jgi:hypothetical protein